NALYFNLDGKYNTGLGLRALYNNTSGNTNTAVGYLAGTNLTTGSNNVDIANQGLAGESKTIRIGTTGTQTRAFVAGISGVAVTGADVVVNASGQLGVVVSSSRFKKDIRDMGASTGNLMNLRPVTFKYRDDERGITQYGLVAEEVGKVYP